MKYILNELQLRKTLKNKNVEEFVFPTVVEEVVGDMESLETGREDVREEAGEEVGGEGIPGPLVMM